MSAFFLKCLNIMGVPMKNGGHILFPEEAVYLIEHHNAYATDEGHLLTLHGGYRILQECGVSMHKYRAYSALRHAGFAVLRPNRHSVHSLQLHEEQPSRQIDDPSRNRLSYSEDLLNMFPTMRHNRLFMPPLHLNQNIIPIEALDDFVLNPCVYKFTRKSCRDFRRHIRPPSWPCFDRIRRYASSWTHFALLRSEILNRTTPSSRFSLDSSESDRCYDFDVYLIDRFTHSIPSPPAFVVICFGSRDGAMNCTYVHRSAERSTLVLSIFDSGHVSFIEISGKPIDLKQYLKDLTAKSVKKS
ncbi:hypothetical protein KIN20_023909 [Parelaphostrongylus tenuis]|uniref:tRNA-splicing endonuclease subunit Sen54 N-terminal domain-containing protein n=1 Tax=Parelaphostrongylus tenuis TaxID=148309 RepID=A0AAD5QWE5_PARTN|nr:hypothetical protein KIN20_023909 [Parelaphostrongylus tenuis]